MAWQATVYSGLLGVAGVIAFLHAWLAWRNRDELAGLPAAVLLTSMGGWAFAAAVRLGFETLSQQFFWYKVGISIGAVLPTAWLAFIFAYAGYERYLTRRTLALLVSEPLAFLVFIWTNQAHHLVWAEVSLVGEMPRTLTFQLGPVYHVHILYSYLLVAGGILLLVDVFRRTSAIYRRQAALLVAGALLPLLANIAFYLGILPPTSIDLTPLTFAISGAIFGLALFKFDLLNLTPVAREQLITTLGSGLIVVNDEDRIVHINETAETLVPGAAVGDDATVRLDATNIDDLDGSTTTASVDGAQQFYDIHVSPLFDFRGREVGRLVAFQDVTDRRQYEQRLEVSNRLLRHNLRNDMTVVLGWASQIESRTDDETVREGANEIRDVARELGDLSEKARHIERTLDVGAAERVGVDVTELLTELIDEFHEEWPDAVIDLDAPEGVIVDLPDETLFEIALQNLLENAFEHNDARTPEVAVTVDRTDERTIISIADNGPEIPEFERDTLRRGEETALRHSSGLGLWLTHWIADHCGGDLTFERNDPRGNIVTLSIPQSKS